MDRVLEEVFVYRLRARRYRDLVRGLEPEGDETALDLGCGGGPGTRALARALPEGRVIALDTSRYWLDIARRRLRSFDNVEFVEQDIRVAPVPDGSVDLALISFVLHDLPATDRAPVVRATAAKLAPEGRLLVVEPTRPAHGMPSDEVVGLMVGEGLRMLDSWPRGRHAFGAVFVRDPEGVEVPELEDVEGPL
jgi:ubiquinone/menaquinone biosynthesis C-methylase UbiE